MARAVVGAVLLAYLPGDAWGRVALPGARGIERIVLSVGLSLALMVLLLYAGAVALRMTLTPTHAVWLSLGTTLMAWGLLLGRRARLQPRVARDASTPPDPRG